MSTGQSAISMLNDNNVGVGANVGSDVTGCYRMLEDVTACHMMLQDNSADDGPDLGADASPRLSE